MTWSPLALGAAALGVDYTQWRALTIAGVKTDFATFRGAYGQALATKIALRLVFAVVFSGVLFGALPALTIWRNDDLLLGATVLASQVALFTAFFVLSGEAATVVSAGDQAVLGFRPVSSRTYLAVRIANVVINTTFHATLVGYLSMVACLVRADGGLAVAAASMLTVYATSFATTLALLSSYGWLLQRLGARRFATAISYLQFFATLVMMGSFMMVSQTFSRDLLGTMTLTGHAWAWLLPTAWFASYMVLATGHGGVPAFAAAAMSLVSIAVIVRSLGGKLSLEYSARLAELQEDSRSARSRWTRWSLPAFVRRETRAILLLARAQIRADPSFRMAVLSILPITIGLIVAGFYVAGDTAVSPDPFVDGSSFGAGNGMMIGVFMLPASLRRALISSQAFKASWIFHTTPADRVALAVSGPVAIGLLCLAPMLAVVAAILAYWFGNAVHGLVHATVVGCLCYIGLQIDVLLFPGLPFSSPPAKSVGAKEIFGLSLLAPVFGISTYHFATYVMYRSAARVALLLVIFVAMSAMLSALTRWRLRRRSAALEYLG